MAKLYNKSKWPDDLLQRVLARTAKLAGARQSRTVVKVTSNRDLPDGFSYYAEVVWTDRVPSSRSERYLVTDGGFVRFVLPRAGSQRASKMGLTREVIKARARVLYQLFVHEMYHLMENQKRPDLPRAARVNYRRGPHKNRPEEIRAREAANMIVWKGLSAEDEVLIAEIADVLTAKEEQE